MSYFRTITITSVAETVVTPATKLEGVTVRLAGPDGALILQAFHNKATHEDEFTLALEPFEGSGGKISKLLHGVLDASATNPVIQVTKFRPRETDEKE